MKARIIVLVLVLGAAGGVAAYFLGPAGAKNEPTTTRTVRAIPHRSTTDSGPRK